MSLRLWITAATTIVAFAVALACQWPRTAGGGTRPLRDVPASRTVAVGAAAVGTWGASVLGYRLQLVPDVVSLTPWLPALSVLATSFAMLARYATAPGWRPSRRLVLAASAEPLVVAVAVARNPVHPGLVDFVGERDLIFIGHVVYSLVLIALGCYLLARRFEHAHARLRPSLATLIAAALGVIGTEMARLTFGQIVATVGVVAGYVAVRHGGLVDLVPVTRGAVLDQVEDLWFSFDDRGRLVDVNRPAATLMHEVERRRFTAGDPVERVLGPDVELRDGEQVAIRLGPDGDGSVHAWGAVSALRDRDGEVIGWLVTLRVTDLHLEGQRGTPLLAGRAEELARLASIDPVTSCLTRAALDQALADAARDAAHHHRPLALLVVDGDRFKAVNDAHGHLAGDRALREVARRIVRAAGPTAVTGRLGGDEFVVVLPDHDEARASAVASAVTAEVAAAPIDVAEGARQELTVSVGVAELDGSVDELLAAADAAMYAVKRRGGDDVGRVHPAR